MKTKTDILFELWIKYRTGFTNQLEILSENKLKKKLGISFNSVGYLKRHFHEIALLFAKKLFGNSSVKLSAKTVIEKRDKGEWTELEALKNYLAESFEKLKSKMEKQTETDWVTTISTIEFDAKTNAEAFRRIDSNTANCADHLAMINK